MTHTCNKCKKDYASYQSLWKHNKIYHTIRDTIIIPVGVQPVDIPLQHGIQNVDIKKYTCKNCDKEYNNKTSKYRHQIKCLVKNKDTKLTKNDIVELKDEIKQLKIEMKQKNKKVINNNFNNCGNMITNNKLIINKIGSENLLELNNKEITDIFNKEIESVILFIELINFNNRLPKNHSFCTTSLESKYLSTYNAKTNKIDKDRKKYFFDKLLETSIARLEILYNSNKKKFNATRQKEIENNIDNLKSLKKYSFNNKTVKEIMNKINLLSYNKKEIIQNTWTKDEEEESEDDFQKDLDKETTEEMSEESPEKIEYDSEIDGRIDITKHLKKHSKQKDQEENESDSEYSTSQNFLDYFTN